MAYTCKSCFQKVDAKKVHGGMCEDCKKARNEKKVLIGYAGVDSGQLMVVDPCYVLRGKRTDGEGEDLYTKACKATLDSKEDMAGEIIVAGVGGNATVFSSGWGDGNYPIYADYEGGRIVRVVIDMK